MMAGWAYGADGKTARIPVHLVEGDQAGTGCQQCSSPRSLGRVGIEIELAPAGGTEPLDPLDVVRVVDSAELTNGCLTRRDVDHLGAGRSHTGDDRVEALGTLRMGEP